MRQASLDFGATAEPGPGTEAGRAMSFQDADPRDIVLGAVRLDRYLEESGLGWVVKLRELLRGVGVSELEAGYQAGGKPPFHPHVMLGLIVYGIVLGLSSLRELEALARRDVGAWWMTGGLQPDHSTIGRFFVRHAEAIEGGLFEAVTRHVLRRLRLPTHDVAADGTVIEAAASRLSLLTAEAAASWAETQEDGAARDAALKAAENAEERTEARHKKGRTGDAVVARTEPDAVVQKQKDGRIRPSYKPSIIANEHRLILAQKLHPSSENAVFQGLVAQAERTLEHPVPTMSLDAGYCCLTVLLFCLHNSIDVLCPSGRLDAEGEPHKKRKSGRYAHDDFEYDEDHDAYVCPAGKRLERGWARKDGVGNDAVVYKAKASDCQTCPLRAQCTESKTGRRVTRYDQQDVLDAARQVMDQPSARRRYRKKRQASVEPVFSVLRGRGLVRFRRRGRQGAAVEFAMHCIAYNIERAVRLEARLGLVVLCARTQSGPWRPVAAWLLRLA